MPIDSIGMDIKYSGVDMEPKTYSPMSGSDENMSSPPSVLTTASAGSCTPSSLPSAGSTPSSIPSAGSTPYQFVSQEESTVIKPLTPSDHHSLPPSTPDQPITPEPSVQLGSSDTNKVDLGPAKRNSRRSTVRNLSDHSSSQCLLSRHDKSPGISDEDCPCLICSEKQNLSLQILSCIDQKDNEEKEKQTMSSVPIMPVVISDKCSITNKVHKPKLPKVKEPNTVKVRRKSAKTPKNNGVQYQSEIAGDPESSCIKIRIKLTPTGSSKQKSYSPVQASVPTSNADDAYDFDSTDNSHGKQTPKKKSFKRKSSPTKAQTKLFSKRGKKFKKAKKCEPFIGWGTPLREVDGELQSGWAYSIPEHILEKIFNYATHSDDCIPFLHRISKVCRLWRQIAVRPKLWHTIDLASGLIKPKHRTERKLLWIVENRLNYVEDLNIAGWVPAATPYVLNKISELCPRLKALNLTNCSGLHNENLSTLIPNSPQLQRLDLTNIMGGVKPKPRSAVGQQSISELADLLKGNLTHLVLANNTLSNVPSIINSLAAHCSELNVLDLSSVETIGRDSVRLDMEKLQTGCPKLKVLRLANSLFRLNQNSITVQVASPGFPDLEELSLAVDDRVNIGMNGSELERILKTSNKLRLLDVRGCHNITDSSLVKLQPWDIEHLYLSGGSTPRIYSDRLELVVRKWQHSLQELDLSWTGSSVAIDAAMLALAEEDNNKLRILNLCGSSVTFDPVKKLLKKCSALEWLNLTSCRAMPRGVKRLYDTSSTVAQFMQNITSGKYDESPDAD